MQAMKKSLQKVFTQKGLILKEGTLIVSKTGEKFSGTIKRHVGTFGFIKETRKYDNGLLSEKLYHNLFGKELDGYFYKNGILHTSVNVNSYPFTKSKLYSINEYYKGDNAVVKEGYSENKGSIFKIISDKLGIPTQQ